MARCAFRQGKGLPHTPGNVLQSNTSRALEGQSTGRANADPYLPSLEQGSQASRDPWEPKALHGGYQDTQKAPKEAKNPKQPTRATAWSTRPTCRNKHNIKIGKRVDHEPARNSDKKINR